MAAVRLAALGVGDLVLVAKGGRRFHARVIEVSRGTVRFEPLERGISYRHASSRELIDHWRHARRRRQPGEPTPEEQAPPALPAAGQLSLAGKLDRPAAGAS